MKKIKQSAVFLDRDGNINVEKGYIRDIAELELYPGVGKAVKSLNEAGILAILITNQSGAARGFYPESHIQALNERTEELLSNYNARLDAIYYCPHHPDDGCSCRKPKPGSILKAASDFDIDLAVSWMVGDSESDLQAGTAAGCRVKKVTKEQSLLDIVDQILV